MRPTEVVVLARRQRWLAWRDVVMVLLPVALVLLVRQMGSLQSQLREASAKRGVQIDALTTQVEALRVQLGVKDARIRQLTDTLIRYRIPVPPAPAPSPTPGPVATPSRSAEPRPSPHVTGSHGPSVRPSPSPDCLAVLAGTCLTPPPAPFLGGPISR